MKKTTNNDYTDFFSETFLFDGITKDKVAEILKSISPTIISYTTGDVIFSPCSFEKKIGFVLQGECIVERIKADGTNIPLNTLKRAESFGILTLLSKEDSFPTLVRAKRNTTIIFLSRDDFINLIRTEHTISINTIAFMSDRIAFLNRKISTFSADSVEQKFAKMLFDLYCQTKSRELSLNIKKASETLNSGRASIYRALDSLVQQEIIKIENKKIIISNPEGLERISK